MLWQPSLPEKYTSMTTEALEKAIFARKKELGDQLVILGHHYQQDQVIQFADFTGDSFKLSQLAAEAVAKRGSKYVVFAGVHFMAESADILTPEDVAVILPDLSAGCSMADMADYDDTAECWRQIHETLEHHGQSDLIRVIPICYMNCTAAIKSFCGEHGGAVCTSSNADKILRWALAGGDEPLKEGQSVKIIFLPDQHLGKNTGVALGYDPVQDMAIWNPKATQGLGGLDEDDILRATFLLWKGHCSVHKLFRPEHVDEMREKWPDVTVIVHPECAHEVVQKADISGSTEKIIQAIAGAEPGSRWAVGTEVHLVTRIANEAAKRGVEVTMLSGCQCLCTTMYRIDMPHLLWVLDELSRGKVVNQIKVHPHVREWSLKSLQRMLDVTADAKWAAPVQTAEVSS